MFSHMCPHAPATAGLIPKELATRANTAIHHASSPGRMVPLIIGTVRVCVCIELVTGKPTYITTLYMPVAFGHHRTREHDARLMVKIPLLSASFVSAATGGPEGVVQGRRYESSVTDSFQPTLAVALPCRGSAERPELSPLSPSLELGGPACMAGAGRMALHF
ncbi:unnamed protein product [Gadus morhua 'NCC']